MISYTGYQWLLIDAANNFGHDKMLFADRIQWATDNLPVLESLADKADTKPLYLKAVQAIRKAQAGLPTGHLVGVDAVCSGIQIMSVLTGCVSGATATGLVDPNKRADAYTQVTEVMNGVLGTHAIVVPRGDAKDALMTTMYGSRAKPIEIFGEDTPELSAFYQAAAIVAPGAWELLQVLRASWQPYALVHAWKLPDGFDARVKVMEKVETRIEVDELDHATFTYEYYENIGSEKGLSLIANVIHSVDGYVLRAMHRRCNYDRQVMEHAAELVEAELIRRMLGGVQDDELFDITGKVRYYVNQYERSAMPDVVILPHLDSLSVQGVSQDHLKALSRIVNQMLEYKPFALITIHDEFKAHPSNVNHVRQNYINILADLADSNLLTDLLRQITGKQDTYQKLSNNLSALIKGSEYGLC